MASYIIHIDDTGESYRCADYRSVPEGMEALSRKGIPVGCRQGGCVLSCHIKPTSDLRLSGIGKMKKNVCRTVGSDDVPSFYST
jgi:hypothetical protein